MLSARGYTNRRASLLVALALSSALFSACGAAEPSASTVNPPAGDGMATLSWEAPTTRNDGSPLNNLAGFEVYMGTSSGTYTSSVDVGLATQHVFDGLAPGRYVFAVRAYDAFGQFSGFSEEVVFTLR